MIGDLYGDIESCLINSLIRCFSKSKFVKSVGVLQPKSVPNESIGNGLDNFERSEVPGI